MLQHGTLVRCGVDSCNLHAGLGWQAFVPAFWAVLMGFETPRGQRHVLQFCRGGMEKWLSVGVCALLWVGSSLARTL